MDRQESNNWRGYYIRINGPCTRCVMITLPQGDLPKDLGILRTVTRYNQVNVGVYASVLRGGTIRRRPNPTRRVVVVWSFGMIALL